jgi:hypothetical protein
MPSCSTTTSARRPTTRAYAFSTPAPALGLPRVIVLMGPRTCSASEQVINGLRGAGVEVVAVGDTTCGKPVGFLPTNACGQTYSVVNFESGERAQRGPLLRRLRRHLPGGRGLHRSGRPDSRRR